MPKKPKTPEQRRDEALREKAREQAEESNKERREQKEREFKRKRLGLKIAEIDIYNQEITTRAEFPKIVAYAEENGMSESDIYKAIERLILHALRHGLSRRFKFFLNEQVAYDQLDTDERMRAAFDAIIKDLDESLGDQGEYDLEEKIIEDARNFIDSAPREQLVETYVELVPFSHAAEVISDRIGITDEDLEDYREQITLANILEFIQAASFNDGDQMEELLDNQLSEEDLQSKEAWQEAVKAYLNNIKHGFLGFAENIAGAFDFAAEDLDTEALYRTVMFGYAVNRPNYPGADELLSVIGLDEEDVLVKDPDKVPREVFEAVKQEYIEQIRAGRLSGAVLFQDTFDWLHGPEVFSEHATEPDGLKDILAEGALTGLRQGNFVLSDLENFNMSIEDLNLKELQKAVLDGCIHSLLKRTSPKMFREYLRRFDNRLKVTDKEIIEAVDRRIANMVVVSNPQKMTQKDVIDRFEKVHDLRDALGWSRQYLQQLHLQNAALETFSLLRLEESESLDPRLVYLLQKQFGIQKNRVKNVIGKDKLNAWETLAK